MAVANLVRNAVLHGRPGDGGPGRLAVAVGATTVTVDDAGPGIPPAERARVLERFERGPNHGGTGLGLTIARQVALAHGGSLTIGDSPLGGARLTLTLAPLPAGAGPSSGGSATGEHRRSPGPQRGAPAPLS